MSKCVLQNTFCLMTIIARFIQCLSYVLGIVLSIFQLLSHLYHMTDTFNIYCYKPEVRIIAQRGNLTNHLYLQLKFVSSHSHIHLFT